MAKKEKKKPGSGQERPEHADDAPALEADQRLVAEVAALVYAAKGFDPASLASLPPDSAVRTATRYVAWSMLLERRLVTVEELQWLPLVEATELAVERARTSEMVTE